MTKIALLIIIVLLFACNSYASLQFDGVDDYLAVPDNDNWNFGASNFTIEVWTKFDTLSRNGILACQDAGGATKMTLYLDPLSYTMLTFIVWENRICTMLMTEGDVSYETNRWYHIALTRDGNIWSFYRDGVLAASKYQEVTIPDFTSPLRFGVYTENYGALEQYFDGGLSDIRIWDDARTQAEIDYWKDYPLTGNEQDLLGCWPLDESGGDIARDISPFGNSGQVYGTNFSPEPVIPEPTTMLLLPLGLAGFRFLKKRKA